MKIDILGIKIDKIEDKDIIGKIYEFLNSEKGHYIITANAEMIVEAQKDKEFRDIINTADLVLPDGSGPVFASRIVSPKNKLNKWIAGVDLVYKILKNLNDLDSRKKVFFLGAKEGVAKSAAQRLKKLFPKLEIAGIFSGDAAEKGLPRFDNQVEAGDRVAVSIINQTKPDILFVAYGAPKQEKWIARNLKKMPNVKLAIGVGGAFDIISGRIKRAPAWMRKAGLEWLWRLIQEPRRIGRIYNATAKFMWLVLIKRLQEL